MKRRQYKQNNSTCKAILFLCLSGIVLGELHNVPDVREVTLETITVYINWGAMCVDTLIIENINLRVERAPNPARGFGSACVGGANGRLLLTNTDTLIFNNCREPFGYWWKKGNIGYSSFIDSASWQRFNDTIVSFEKSPASCLSKPWGPFIGICDDGTLRIYDRYYEEYLDCEN
jgi:hypothetical protein